MGAGPKRRAEDVERGFYGRGVTRRRADSDTVRAMSKRSPAASFGLFALFAAGVSVVLFLAVAGLFSSWNGVVTATAAPIDGARTPVWVYLGEGDLKKMNWPSEAVSNLGLRVDPNGMVPAPLPDDLPSTSKSRFSLSFIVTDAERRAQIYPTLSVQALSAAALCFIVLLLGRNMVVAGSPARITPRPLELPKAQPPAGQVAPQRKTRPKKGPPPPRRRSRRR